VIITRYIIKEHIGPFIFGLSLILFIFTLNLVIQMLNKVTGKGIPVEVIIELFALNLAWIVALAVPMAVLVASLSGFGRLSGDGEITALRSSGVSPLRMMRGPLIVATLLAITIGYFNNNILPEMNHRAKLLMIDISRKKPTLNIEPGIYAFIVPRMVLLASGVNTDDGTLQNVTIYDERTQGKRSIISALNGQLKYIAQEEMIRLTLKQGEIHRPTDSESNGWEWTRYDSAVFRISAPDMMLKRQKEGWRGDREMTVVQMRAEVARLRLEIAERRTDDASFNNKRIAQYLVEIHKKFSIPTACIVFILFGAPLGMMAHKGGIGSSAAISLLFFTIYWALLYGGETMADRGWASPAVAMWTPNLFFALLGIYLIGLAGRRTTLPLVGWFSELFARIKHWRKG